MCDDLILYYPILSCQERGFPTAKLGIYHNMKGIFTIKKSSRTVKAHKYLTVQKTRRAEVYLYQTFMYPPSLLAREDVMIVFELS